MSIRQGTGGKDSYSYSANQMNLLIYHPLATWDKKKPALTISLLYKVTKVKNKPDKLQRKLQQGRKRWLSVTLPFYTGWS